MRRLVLLLNNCKIFAATVTQIKLTRSGPPLCCSAVSSTLKFHSSAIVNVKGSVRSGKGGKHKMKSAVFNSDRTDPQSLISEKVLNVNDYLKQMKMMEVELTDQMVSNFSNRVDLRRYENVQFEMDIENNAVKQTTINRVARVSMNNPHSITVDFSRNPSTMKAAKVALEKHLQVNAQASGSFLHIQIPPMTREGREQLGHSAKTVLNEYKNALNEIYCKFAKKIEKTSKIDEARKAVGILLAIKKAFENKGDQIVKSKQEALLKEQV